jgi:hypothetical protein
MAMLVILFFFLLLVFTFDATERRLRVGAVVT